MGAGMNLIVLSSSLLTNALLLVLHLLQIRLAGEKDRKGLSHFKQTLSLVVVDAELTPAYL
jgi:hypothetical protein